MRKVLIALVLVLFVASLPAEKAFITPGESGKIIPPSEAEESVRMDRGVLQWLYYDQGGTPDYYLSGVSDVDTFEVWFKPAAPCSLLAYRVWNAAFIDVNQDQFTMFAADMDDGIDYGSFPEYHNNGTPSSYAGFNTILQDLDTLCYGSDTVWSIVTDTLVSPFDNGQGIFGVGWTKARGDSAPNPYIWAGPVNTPYHSLMYRDRGHGYGWYTSYHALRCMALVSFYENPPPVTSLEGVPDTYNTGNRVIYIQASDFGVPQDSSGVETLDLMYSVNGGATNSVAATMIAGDSSDAYFMATIPGPMTVGDTVSYWTVATDYQAAADTTNAYSYIIREGTSKHFLWVEDDYTATVYPGLFTKYGADMDVWDAGAYGYPDSSVIAFHTFGSGDTSQTIVWKGWGSTILGAGQDWGAGVVHNDSMYIKQHLDNGGNFFLADQDQGYSFGVTPGYGQTSVSGWVRDYMGIQGIYDDNPATGGAPLTLFSSDGVYANLFAGAGNQTAGQIFVAPYYALTGGFGYAYTAVFDSILSYATPSMFTGAGQYVSYRLDGNDGATHTGKVVNFGFPWEYVANPSDSLIDYVAVDSLFEEAMRWLGVPLAGFEEDIEPGKTVKLMNISRPVTGEANIKFFLPERMTVRLAVYDNTGRCVKTLVNGTIDGGINTVRWSPKAAGVYFYRLTAGNETYTDKMVVIR